MLQMLLQNSVVVIVFTLAILVFIHELGHFLVGKFFGMAVKSFSIGFGPTLVAKTYGSTKYRIGIIPLGGYVEFVGARPEDPVPEDIDGKPLHQTPAVHRMLMVLAGPLANLLLAACAFSFIGYHGVPYDPAIIGITSDDSPAASAGLEPGDRILKVNGTAITKWSELITFIKDSTSDDATPSPASLDLDIQRQDGTVHRVSVVPEMTPEGPKLGIMNRFLPPRLRVLSQHFTTPPFHNLSLVTAISVTSQDPATTDPQQDLETATPVSSFHELAGLIGHHLRAGTPALTLTLLSPYHPDVIALSESYHPIHLPPALAQDPSHQEPQYYTLTLPSLSALASSDSFPALSHPTTSHAALGEQVLATLGFTHSALTVLYPFASQNTTDFPLHSNDRIVSCEGLPITHLFEWYRVIHSLREHPEITVTVERHHSQLSYRIPQLPITIQSPEGAKTIYVFPYLVTGHLVPTAQKREQHSFFSSIAYGMQRTYHSSMDVLTAIIGLITGDVPLKSLGGPILIAKVARDSASQGLTSYLTILALISINLFLINLFPIPVLDGGQLVLIFAEMVQRGRPSARFIEHYQKIGFVMILALIVLATYNDLSRFWLSILQSLGIK